ncbi:MAG: hypothetical protein ACXWD7_05445 [Solirubrobacterales bacterium]
MSEEQKGEAPEAASEEELRAQLEDEIRKVRIEDLLLQSIVSVLNLSARRIAKDDERDLAQAKLGIDACRALVDFLPEEAQTQVREALTELQLLYAKHAGEQKTGDSEEKPADGEEKE